MISPMIQQRVFWKVCASIIAALLAVFLVPATATAESSSGSSTSALTVSPAITEQVTPGGQKKEIVLRVSNITDFPLPISSTVRNFIPAEQLDTPGDKSKYDASKWFTIADPDFILQPKQTHNVTVAITPPAGAEPGGHYATIYFTPLVPETALTPSTAYLSAQVGTLAFLIVPGALIEHLSTVGFSTAAVHQSRTIDFSLKLKNSGNVHLAPNATLLIRNWAGHQVASVPLKSGIVLPGTNKEITASWQASAPLGRYTATANVLYGSSHSAAQPQTITFWVIPWVSLLSIIILLILAIFVFFRTRGRWKRAWRILVSK